MDEYIIILRTIRENPAATQRELAKALNVSLGKTNQLIAGACAEGYIKRPEKESTGTAQPSESPENTAARSLRGESAANGRNKASAYRITEKGCALLQQKKVDAALILASGFGSRFVPLSYETPKGLLTVFGERMIERQIRQLREAGITDIALMVGYLKEKFDYLIDKYNVKLIYNPEFANKNTLATMYHASEFMRGKNCYVLASDNWLRENMYHTFEAHSWYSAAYMEGETREWAMRFSKNGLLKEVTVGGRDAYCMYGPAYFTKEFADAFLPMIAAYYRMPGTEQFYWEDVLIRNLRNLPEIYANRQPADQVYEFENLEELRLFDEKYVHNSGSAAMQQVAEVFHIAESDIINIRCLKAGMTNKSWLFSVKEDSGAPAELRGRSYICRIPGPGTEKLINRRHEGAVYDAVTKLGITEQLVYFNPENGYKISRYYHGARNADFAVPSELDKCMSMLKGLHNSGLSLPHDFDIRRELLHYEKLCTADGREIPFEDYQEIRAEAVRMLDWLASLNRPRTICHIDSVHDNFIFTDEGLKMIDWEYAGMADPLIDLGMSAIYSYMTYEEARALLEAYERASYLAGAPAPTNADVDASPETAESAQTAAGVNAAGVNAAGVNASGYLCSDPGIALRGFSQEENFHVVAAYMGLGGLLWALWAVYKASLGETFGDYTLKMYRYFKNSFQILQNYL